MWFSNLLNPIISHAMLSCYFLGTSNWTTEILFYVVLLFKSVAFVHWCIALFLSCAVPPAYYAHLAAFRARYYVEGESSDGGSTPGSSGQAVAREGPVEVRQLPKIKENVKDVMFYCWGDCWQGEPDILVVFWLVDLFVSLVWSWLLVVPFAVSE